MLKHVRLSVERQVLYLLLCTGLSATLAWAYGFYPRTRMSPELFAKGFLAGTSVIVLYLLIYGVLLLAFPSRFYPPFREISKKVSGQSIRAIIGAGLVAGAGEELLFRVYIFSLLSSFEFSLALSLHFILMMILYYQGRRQIVQTTLCALECSLYAVLFYYHRSFFLIASAHCIAEIGLSFVLRNRVVIECLKKETISIAELKKLFNSK